ncbi:YqaA family protein [Polynucleobacter sp. MWH-Berg-3C6]|uniref:YqaA family protein n=1 Tax=Polynucleobacter sp. MWH-Berg-3C6 TaxID=1855882 RepID=UPI001C0CCFCE|nr:YqaA family protein [Polynucleobacter sp. MWH-Berg-3C6]MBU3550211.1 DedA family protein [Polynucleobacter sp. MWH-Berg-3C6]
MDQALQHFFGWFGLPSVGLPAVFISAFVSATLLPVGSEPILFGYTTLNPDLYWVAIFVATIGNTLGGMFDWWLGYVANKGIKSDVAKTDGHLREWLIEWGPKMLLLSWLPGFGDPLCIAAGWLRLAWFPCLIYMFIGKLLRYLTMTWLLTLVPDSFWHQLGHWLHLI